MFAIPGIIGLMISIYVRPHEWSATLADVPFLQICMGLTLLGFVADLAMRRTQLVRSATLGTAAVFIVWCFITLLVRNPSLAAARALPIVLPFLLYAIISHSIRTVSAFCKVVFTLFGAGLFVACVGVAQGTSDYQCLVVDRSGSVEPRLYTDGRPCPVDDARPARDAVEDCYTGGKPNTEYHCEKAGPFMTSSIGGRIRYLGVLADPNELALATSVAVPFALAFFEIKRSVTRFVLLVGTMAVVAAAVIFSGSRGGQLVFCAVLCAYFVRKYGLTWGATAAGILGAPLAVLGGRSGEGADESSLERLEAAGAGLKMLMAYPFRGVGQSQFTEEHHMTAHNAYILAAGELGVLGLYLFSALLYLSGKVTVAALYHPFSIDDPDARALRSLSMAMLAAFAGLAVGIFFLSWTYHFVLWLHFGLAGALHCVMKHKYPWFDVRLSMKERVLVVVFWVVFLPIYVFHIKRSGCW